MSQGRARSCENGAFGTEIVRGILGEKNLGLKPPKKRKLQNPFLFRFFEFFPFFSGFSLYIPPPDHPPQAANINNNKGGGLA